MARAMIFGMVSSSRFLFETEEKDVGSNSIGTVTSEVFRSNCQESEVCWKKFLNLAEIR